MLRQCEHFLPSCTFYLTGAQIRKIEVESRDSSEGILAFLSASSLPLRPPPPCAWFSFPTLSLSRARPGILVLFSFWFPLLFSFRRSPPCFVFHHVTSRPLLFVYFVSRHLLHLDAGMNCGSDMFLSFAVFSQSSIFHVNLLTQCICFSSDLFETFSRKENELDVSVKRYCSPSYTKGQACFFIQKPKNSACWCFCLVNIFSIVWLFRATSSDNCLSKHNDCVEIKGIRFFFNLDIENVSCRNLNG